MTSNNLIYIHQSNSPVNRVLGIYHAGGYAGQYTKWRHYWPHDVDLILFERPGRGRRQHEVSNTNSTLLLEEIYESFALHFEQPYILYGHSVGAQLAYGLTQLLQERKKPLPSKLCIAGRESPDCPPKKDISYLPDSEFIAALKELYDLSDLISNNQELISYFLPILRADIQLNENVQQFKREKIRCPIQVLCGKSEGEEKRFSGWHKYTTGSFSFQQLPGDHFFVFTSPQLVIQQLLAKDIVP